MEYTIRKAKKRNETYPRGVLVKHSECSYTLETLSIREQDGSWRVGFGWNTYFIAPTLDEATRWAMRALDRHFNRSEA